MVEPGELGWVKESSDLCGIPILKHLWISNLFQEPPYTLHMGLEIRILCYSETVGFLLFFPFKLKSRNLNNYVEGKKN